MADNTHIEWADATVNWINGCELASPGCTNCYAMRLAGTRMKNDPTRKDLTSSSKAGPVWNGMVRNNPKHLVLPVAWRRARRIFWNAHGDMFLGNVPDGWIDMQFAIMAITPQHTHMCLTKRSKRMRAYLTNAETPRRIAQVLAEFGDLLRVTPAMRAKALAPAVEGVADAVVWPLPNVWMGVSIEDQERADQRIPDLLNSPAAIRFLSAEPLLGPIDVRRWLNIMWECGYCRQYFDGGHRQHCTACGKEGGWCGSHKFNARNRPQRRGVPYQSGSGIDWIIVGGESGPDARPMHPDWVSSLRDQCAAGGAIFHFKQWGEWAATGPHNLEMMIGPGANVRHPRFKTASIPNSPKAGQTIVTRIGKKAAGNLLDGVEHNSFPVAQA